MGFRTNMVCVCSSKPNKITTFTTFWHPHGSAHLCTSARRSSFWPSSKKNLSQMEEPRSPVGSTPKSTFKNKNWGLLISSMSTKARPTSFNNASKRSTVEKTSFSSTPNFRHAWNFSAHKLVRNVIFMLDTPILGNPGNVMLSNLKHCQRLNESSDVFLQHSLGLRQIPLAKNGGNNMKIVNKKTRPHHLLEGHLWRVHVGDNAYKDRRFSSKRPQGCLKHLAKAGGYRTSLKAL